MWGSQAWLQPAFSRLWVVLIMQKTSLVLLFCLSLPAAEAPRKFAVTPDIQGALDRISPNSLRGNLSFLASDLLAGRDTPSKGLDIAAEFIAAQYRKAGIEPAGDDGYFQTAKLKLQQPNREGFALTFADGDKSLSIDSQQVALRLTQALDLKHAAIFKLDLTDAAFLEKVLPEQLAGKVVITEFTRGSMQRGRAARDKLRNAKAALTIMLERKAPDTFGRETTQLFDPEQTDPQSPRISISGEAASRFYDDLKPGLSESAVASLHAAAPKEQTVQLRNVVGILRGSDPSLKETCVLVSAHYDHIGEKSSGDGDRIYNGANDDGSGTVSVIELANALQNLKQRPKRSIVFVTFFGEEKGGFGSRYYARHPVISLNRTVADINLEQVGRTDSTEGEQKDNASVTGFDYSDVADVLQAAGALTGIKVYKNEHASDLYFSASDNVFLAEAGVPAHSICVAFNYSDYHGLGDEWPKIDYENMAKVDRMVAVALLMLAESPESPHWNADNPKAARYLKAWKLLHLLP